MLFTLRSGGTEHPEDSVLQHISDMVSVGGIFDVPANDFKVTAQAVPDMTILVNSGRAYLKTTGTPAHPVRSTANESVTITANASGNPRIDALVLYVDRAASPNTESSNVAKLIAVAGTPAASPVAPTDAEIIVAVGAGSPFLRLANIAVSSGATSIVNANITDFRTSFAYRFNQVALTELVTTPSNPAAGFDKLYFKNDGKFYRLNSGGTEQEVGAAILSTSQYAPQGFLINGKIVPSVTANNLTVAIKGMDGNNPSPTNPVYIRIGDTVRTITAALSVTKNAGTNWFASGSAELATNEVDYFVYLGYNATDGVTIGFSRVAFGRQYGDFNATTTNEDYGAISTITNAVSTDFYEIIGRFAATLSAGAGFTWTVPTFTSLNLVQTPTRRSRRLAYTPTVTASTGTITSHTTLGHYVMDGSKIEVDVSVAINTVGTGAQDLRLTLPHLNLISTPFAATEAAVVGIALAAYYQFGSGFLVIDKYDHTTVIIAGYINFANGSYYIKTP